MTGALLGLDWAAFEARARVLALNPSPDQLAEWMELAQAVEVGAVTGAMRRQARRAE